MFLSYHLYGRAGISTDNVQDSISDCVPFTVSRKDGSVYLESSARLLTGGFADFTPLREEVDQYRGDRVSCNRAVSVDASDPKA